MRRVRRVSVAFLAFYAAVLLLFPFACDPEPKEEVKRDYSETRTPCKSYSESKRPYFGDLHVHTTHSFDAWAYSTKVTPSQAYAFMKGQPVYLPPLNKNGQGTRKIQLPRPLDFGAVTDHSEFLGEVSLCITKGSPAYELEICKNYRKQNADSVVAFAAVLSLEKPVRMSEVCGKGSKNCHEHAQKRWRAIQLAAENAYDRSAGCNFTSFVGYEYTATPNVSNMHRNVIFRNAAVPEKLLTAFEYNTPFKLWKALQEKCLKGIAKCDVLTITHNFNLSNGNMYFPRYPTVSNKDQQKVDAELRRRLEPLMEMFQHKGDMECRNGLSGIGGPDDPHCNFEKLRPLKTDDCGDKTGQGGMRLWGCLSRLDFARNIFKIGMLEEKRLGINPYKVGVIGSTDTHNGIGGYTMEYDFKGHIGTVDDSSQKMLGGGNITHDALINNPGGLAVVWAKENSRDALFNSMQKRETYATSGTRIIVRTFAGWSFPDDICKQSDDEFGLQGYKHGVPMGGTVGKHPGDNTAMKVVVLAKQDQGVAKHPGVPLQKVQVIKGWVDSKGKVYEKVYTIDQSTDKTAAVNPYTCKRKGTGISRSCKVWTDPDFDPKQRAFYYVRVLENESCRWSSYLCNAIPKDKRPKICSDPKLPRIIQERAWTSPMWYSPK